MTISPHNTFLAQVEEEIYHRVDGRIECFGVPVLFWLKSARLNYCAVFQYINLIKLALTQTIAGIDKPNVRLCKADDYFGQSLKKKRKKSSINILLDQVDLAHLKYHPFDFRLPRLILFA